MNEYSSMNEYCPVDHYEHLFFDFVYQQIFPLRNIGDSSFELRTLKNPFLRNT